MKSGQYLYHYCATQTAFAILQSRVFRLSALSAANDSLEGRVLGRVFAQLLTATGLPRGVVEVVSVIVDGYPESTEGFALCLSEKGDLLSQWRAYARDGTGIAIGFDPETLTRDFGPVNFGAQFFELIKVEYGEEGLRQTLAPFAEEVKGKFFKYGEFVRLNDGKTREYVLSALADRQKNLQSLFRGQREDAADLMSRLMKVLAPLHFRVYGTKPQSFHEEKEWRLLRYRHRVPLEEIDYFADSISVRPFIPCLMADPARQAIQEVILGPKHRSNINWMRAFLDSVGLSHVKVTRSKIESYR
ncbi:DUF2971 domain-containing protein [Stappia sp. F7233]|uniref:DUF2971 domain-containing protein n=1 Tax=Stappia albiluteola TaxID=2758565 RepID=A0A839AI22_9HYPH|nr:DUF2971 domain-containing protein [Stappia albiluteola]MBA5778726.1 DUF2971 domain-containing protein [Stappia albiluteola]